MLKDKPRNKFLSIVIPVWKRPYQLELILSYFNKEIEFNKDFEIILCDSNSGFEIDNIISKFTKDSLGPHISHLQCKLNSPAAKRNMGIQSAKGSWIILLDDDCVPFDDFLDFYINSIENSEDEKNVFLGIIEYQKFLVESENYYRYRQSRHLGPWRQDLDYSNLPFNNISTMNMCINRQAVINSKVRFDESYDFYGEDIDYGLQLKEMDFKMFLVHAKVSHLETTRTIDEYVKKLNGVAAGIAKLEEKWKNSYYDIFYSKTTIGFIRRIITLRMISILIFNKFFVNLAIYFLKKTNKNKFLYFPFIYHFVVYSKFLNK